MRKILCSYVPLRDSSEQKRVASELILRRKIYGIMEIQGPERVYAGGND